MATPLRPLKSLQFGDFELDLEAQQLRKAGALVRLQPHPFKVLAVLACRAGQIVSREELRREVWGDETFVDFEQGLNFCIRQIRVMLADDAQAPRYIETMPRRGYRFIADIQGVDPAALGEIIGRKITRPWLQERGRKLGFAAVLAFFLVALITAATLGHFRRPPLLTAKDSLLVTDFVNNTGDPVFDGTLRKAVSVDLGQSPYLNIVSDVRVRQTLGLMGKLSATRITPEIGREICLRIGTKVMLNGTIAALGNQYVLTLEAVDVNSGDILAEERAQAASKEQVLNALGKSDEKLRRKLGETLGSIQQFGKPLEQATTSSLEALQLYTVGLDKHDAGVELASIPFFQRAVQLDPNFASAYAHLGVAYSNIEQWNLAEEYEKKALALSDRVSEREKLYITAHYWNTVGQKEKEIQTYELYSQLYPQDALPQNNLSFNYEVLGRYDKALDHALVGLKLAPNSATMHSEAAHAYAGLGRLEEAKAIVREGLERAPNTWLLHLDLSNIALAQADGPTRDRADADLKGNPEGTLNLIYRDASLAASQGRLRDAEDLYSQAEQLALKLELKDNASYAVALRALYQAHFQHPTAARASARTALRMSQMFDVIVSAAWALALAGDDREATTLINDLAKRRSEDTLIQFVWVPGIEALISLNHGDAEHAIQILGPAAQYDRAILDPMLVRGDAYLQAKRATEAQEEFQRILALKSRFPSDPACSLAQLGLARAYALAGDKARGLAAYENLFALWRDADPDVPILRQAKAEYAKLR
jgi:eukaryotic-like serine/threonine-protein kinase